MERVLGVPGVELVLDGLDERVAFDLEQDSSAGQTIYREQYHGNDFKRHPPPMDPRRESDAEGPILDALLNVSLDWFNPHSGTMYEQTSIGPLLVQLADLPQRLRSNQELFLLLGITPGESFFAYV